MDIFECHATNVFSRKSFHVKYWPASTPDFPSEKANSLFVLEESNWHMEEVSSCYATLFQATQHSPEFGNHG